MDILNILVSPSPLFLVGFGSETHQILCIILEEPAKTDFWAYRYR